MRWRSRTRPEVDDYREIFNRIRPAVLFCSHQRPTTVLPAVLAARSLGIPTATFIFSWDNLSSKGRIAAPFDHYLVWSDHMRQELLQFYPHVPHENVHIVGHAAVRSLRRPDAALDAARSSAAAPAPTPRAS